MRRKSCFIPVIVIFTILMNVSAWALPYGTVSFAEVKTANEREEKQDVYLETIISEEPVSEQIEDKTVPQELLEQSKKPDIELETDSFKTEDATSENDSQTDAVVSNAICEASEEPEREDEPEIPILYQSAPIIESLAIDGLSSGGLIPDIQNKPIKIAMSPSSSHMLILKEDGTVWSVGDNTYGQLGDGTNISRTIPVQVHGLTKVIDIAAGVQHSLALKSDGTVWAWGRNYCGQLGDNTKTDKFEPQRVKGPGEEYKLSGITAISAGRHHNLALREDGNVFAWGDNQYGQLGDITVEDYAKRPIQMKRDNGYAPDTEEYYDTGGYIENVKRICAGGMTSFVIIQGDPEDTGTLFGCGLGRKNRLWSEELEGYYVYYFHEIGAFSYDAPCFAAGYTKLMIQEQKSGYIYAAVGDNNMFQIKSDGTLWGYGSNDYGQAGYDNAPDQWTMIPDLHDIICVTSGAYSTAALRSDGMIFSWGYNLYGQFGIDSVGDRTNIPVFGDDYGNSFESAYNAPFEKRIDGVIAPGTDADYFSFVPDASGVFSFSIQDGVEYHIFDQDHHEMKLQGSLWHMKKDQTYYLKITSSQSTVYSFVLTRVIARLTKTARTIGEFTLAVTEKGYINKYTPEEWFVFKVKSSNNYQIDTGSITNPTIGVYTVSGDKRSLVKSGANGRLQVHLEPDIMYYLRITGMGTSPEYDYFLKIINADIISKESGGSFQVAGGTNYLSAVKANHMLPAALENQCFMVVYDQSNLALLDIAAQQYGTTMSSGFTKDRKIEFLSVEPGVILFRFHHSIPEGKSFTGLINAFKFKAEANGEAAIHVFLCPLSEDQQGREMQIELLKSIANDIQNGEVE